MPRFDSPLNNLKIASPCSADWDGMFGDERKRFCGECKLNVYNLSGMTRKQAEELLENSEGRLCVRYYQRADGTVLTADCPVGWARVRQRMSVGATAAFSLVMSLVSGVFFVWFFSRSGESPISKRFPIPFSTPTPLPLMGAVAVPSPSPKVKPSVVPRSVPPAPADEEIRRRVNRAAGVEDGTAL